MRNLFLVAALACLVASCSPPTSIVRSWKAPEATNLKFNKILVLALTPQQKFQTGITLEEYLVKDLNTYHLNAVSAKALYGPKTYKPSEKEQVAEQFRKDGFDAVVLIRLLDVNTTQTYVPGTSNYVPTSYYDPFWGSYYQTYERYDTPGYMETTTRFFWETNLHRLSDETLLYSAQSEAFDPSSIESLAKSNAEQVVTDMLKQGVFTK